MNVVKKAHVVRCILCNNLNRRYCDSRRSKTSFAQPKVQNSKLIKRYNKENKILFGNLVETAVQKRRREKREPKTESSDPTDNGKTSEAWWWRNHSRMQVLKQFSCEAAASSNKHSESDSFPETTVVSVSGSQVSKEVPHASGSVNIDKAKTSSAIFHNLNISLPEIVVKNITTFPLINEKKQFCNRTEDSISILNIPLKGANNSARSLYSHYPSVSKILNATLSDTSRTALQKWKEKMISELGEDGFEKYQKSLLDDGSLFHSTIQRLLSGISKEEIIVDQRIEGCWHSLDAAMKDITDVKVLESHVVHGELLYHGIIDCVALYRRKPLLIEWKKSNKQKTSVWNTYDAPLQAAAYMGAMNFDTNYNLKVEGVLIVVAYTDGSPAHVHHINLSECKKYWYLWLKRLQLYWELFKEQETYNGV